MKNTNYEELRKAVAEEIGMADDKVTIKFATKNNGVEVPQLDINDGRRVRPSFNISDLNLDYKNQEKIKEAAKEIVNVFRKTSLYIDVSCIGDRDYMLENAKVKILSAVKNAEMLAGTPHRRICDLAEVAYMRVDSIDGGFVTIDNGMIEMAGITPDELFKAAEKNTADYGYDFFGLGSFLAGIVPTPDDGDMMYVATNRDKMYGASVVAFPELMKKYRDQIGGDVYVIPSSIHEVIFLRKNPDDDGGEVGAIASIIKDVNRSVVADEEILSDKLYTIGSDGELLYA